MLLRKIGITLLLWSGFFGIPACIPDCPDVLPYWQISDMSISIYDTNGKEYNEGYIFRKDTLSLVLEFEHTYVAFNKLNFLNTAQATEKCPSQGENGPDDPIISVNITSNQDFNDFKAGESLNELFLAWGNPKLTVEEWVEGTYGRPFFISPFFVAQKTCTGRRTYLHL